VRPTYNQVWLLAARPRAKNTPGITSNLTIGAAGNVVAKLLAQLVASVTTRLTSCEETTRLGEIRKSFCVHGSRRWARR
jgi:hypothetical protein